jgi:hypothetical protein
MNTTVLDMRNHSFRNSPEIMHLLHQHQNFFIADLLAPKNSRKNETFRQQKEIIHEMVE